LRANAFSIFASFAQRSSAFIFYIPFFFCQT
jgi:hypothetical protein